MAKSYSASDRFEGSGWENFCSAETSAGGVAFACAEVRPVATAAAISPAKTIAAYLRDTLIVLVGFLIILCGSAAVKRFISRLPASRDCQCRKWRTPVKDIASPNLYAAAITPASRTDPPGCMNAVAPALAASSTPSGNGKNASDATTLPLSEDCAFITAIFTESTRLICPAPTATVAPPRANTIALDFTCLHTIQPNRRSCSSMAEGARLVTVFNSSPRNL